MHGSGNTRVQNGELTPRPVIPVVPPAHPTAFRRPTSKCVTIFFVLYFSCVRFNPVQASRRQAKPGDARRLIPAASPNGRRGHGASG
jgi:hypothetical protein